jgi:HEAT repeat protein
MSKNKPVTGAAVGADRTKAVADLIEKIRDSNPEVRTKAWLGAGEVGWPAVPALAEVMADANLEVARAAKRALWKIVRHAGRPGADQERQSVAVHVSSLLAGDKPVSVRREALWMLSEIGEKELIKPIAGLLTNKELREDARMVL